MIWTDSKSSEHVAQQFNNLWLLCYSYPGKDIHCKRRTFIGITFQQISQRIGIKDAPTTPRNLQASLVYEQLHQTVANILHITTNGAANSMQQAVRLVDDALTIIVHATRCAVSRAIGTSTGVMVYQRDMFINLPVVQIW
eukprot:11187232-Ditylum_brightwellii.AAC.1